MNDLAEKALHGLVASRARIVTHPMTALGAAGLAVASVVVVAGGRVGAARSTAALTTWLGLEDPHGASSADRIPGTVLVVGVSALIVLWLVAMTVMRDVAASRAQVWGVAAAWAAPFALGPPALDTGVYRTVASGLLARDGLDPYSATPGAHLGARIVAAIDPGARDVPSAAGPLGNLLAHLAVAIGGGALGAVVVLRALGLLAAVWICALASESTDADGGPPADTRPLARCALNPLLLLYVVWAPRLDGVMIAVVVTALVAARRRRWTAAIALAAAAAALLPQALVAVAVLIVAHSARGRRDEGDGGSGRRPVVRAAFDLAVAAVVFAAAAFVQPHGFGWVRTVGRQFVDDTPFSVVGATQHLIAVLVRDASYDDLVAGARVTAVAAAVLLVAYFVATARSRPVELSVGYALLAVALLAPVLHPWYLVWGVACLAPSAAGVGRVWVVALSAAGCVLTLPGFSVETTAWVTGALLLTIAAAGWRPLLLADRSAQAQRPPAISRTAGRTSAR